MADAAAGVAVPAGSPPRRGAGFWARRDLWDDGPVRRSSRRKFRAPRAPPQTRSDREHQARRRIQRQARRRRRPRRLERRRQPRGTRARRVPPGRLLAPRRPGALPQGQGRRDVRRAPTARRSPSDRRRGGRARPRQPLRLRPRRALRQGRPHPAAARLARFRGVRFGGVLPPRPPGSPRARARAPPRPPDVDPDHPLRPGRRRRVPVADLDRGAVVQPARLLPGHLDPVDRLRRPVRDRLPGDVRRRLRRDDHRLPVP